MLCNDWAYAVTYSTSADRRRALPAWLHYYNHHRPHGSLDRATPGTRLHELTNAAGIYS
jgi:transposase InsO family protein